MKNRVAFALVAALPLALACGGEDTKPVVHAPPVALGDVIAIEIDDRIEATGELVSPSHATIAAEIGGRITALYVDDGAHAASGQRVLEIDPERRNLEVQMAGASNTEAKAALVEAVRAAERVRSLFKSNVASKAQLDQAETALELARSRTDGAAARLGETQRAQRDAEVRAPFDGMVAQRYVSIGEFVQPGTRLFELVALDPIEVEFRVSEIDSSRVKVGQIVGVRVAPYPDEVFEATVTVVAPTIDPVSRTLRVKGTLPNPEARLRPGLFARADLGVARRDAVLMVPEESVLQRSDGQVVFRVVEGDRVERLVVTTGVFKDGRIEIIGGLAAGDKVVTRGHTALVDGSVIAVRDTEGRSLEPDVASGKTEPPAKAE